MNLNFTTWKEQSSVPCKLHKMWHLCSEMVLRFKGNWSGFFCLFVFFNKQRWWALLVSLSFNDNFVLLLQIENCPWVYFPMLQVYQPHIKNHWKRQIKVPVSGLSLFMHVFRLHLEWVAFHRWPVARWLWSVKTSVFCSQEDERVEGQVQLTSCVFAFSSCTVTQVSME